MNFFLPVIIVNDSNRIKTNITGAAITINIINLMQLCPQVKYSKIMVH